MLDRQINERALAGRIGSEASTAHGHRTALAAPPKNSFRKDVSGLVRSVSDRPDAGLHGANVNPWLRRL
jgi:hypothetical protein